MHLVILHTSKPINRNVNYRFKAFCPLILIPKVSKCEKLQQKALRGNVSDPITHIAGALYLQ